MADIGDERRPLVVVGAHVCGLFMEVDAAPAEGESVLGRSFSEPADGGKATNQAVAAAKLGAPVRVLTVVGADERGHRWREMLMGYGLDTRFVIEAPGPTDVGIVMIPPSRIPAIVSVIELGRALDRQLVERHAEAVQGASFVLCQLEASQECAAAAFGLARAAGAQTILNIAPYQPLEPELLALTDLLVANEHEAAALTGHRNGDVEAVTRAASRAHPTGTVIVTAGARGCYFAAAASGSEVQHVPANPVAAADTTGAGDQFIAALAVRLREGAALPAAVRAAVEIAGRSVTRAGTMDAFVSAEELVSAAGGEDR